jgi:hypothetical protein
MHGPVLARELRFAVVGEAAQTTAGTVSGPSSAASSSGSRRARVAAQDIQRHTPSLIRF